MSSMYALLVPEKHSFLPDYFCQIILIIFRSYKAQFISQITLNVACVCLIWISSLFFLLCLICIIIVLLTSNFLQAEKPFENQTFNRLPLPKKERSEKKKRKFALNSLSLFTVKWFQGGAEFGKNCKKCCHLCHILSVSHLCDCYKQ